ncbi:hypothetical protein [Tepidimonas charontis]|uniref:Uncharacterized protein n=1 Tax=Tepidimonas charontis TaxID=2267262 RepID=A0A554X8D2_9BURK|nr:hypothetical protein [Tepidimonas charontis]TSE32092.1 hypothetical protein Tchar_02178 [Tepidimonas charontis]
MTDRYRKKPVEVRAWKISLDGQEPDWVREAFDGGRIDWCPAGEGIYINTLEGRMKANIGDMLIEGVKGELYGCRADIGTHYVRAKVRSTIATLKERLAETTDDLTRCPNCGGPADNGHDREVPPNPYWCSKCSGS